MKSHRHISILLTLCFAVFLGHNLVPHHHHSEVVPVPMSSNCPVDHEDYHRDQNGDHHEGDSETGHHPFHCHAFNDVVFDKYTPPQIEPCSREVQYLINPVSFTNLEPSVTVKTNRYICLKIPDFTRVCFGAISLRAPPVAA